MNFNFILFPMLLIILLVTGCRQDDKENLRIAIRSHDLARIEQILSEIPSLVNIEMEKGGFRPIHRAVYYQNWKMCKLLLKFHPDLLLKTNMGFTAHDIALCSGYKDYTELLIRNGYPESFCTSCGLGDIKKVASMISENKHVMDEKIAVDYYPIHIAVVNNQKDCLDILLAAGDDVNKLGRHKRTPLHFAILAGHCDIAKYLLFKGANPNLKDTGGQTPLHYAGFMNNKELIDILLKYGADKNVVNIYKRKPLDSLSGDSRDVLKPLQAEEHK